MFRRAGGFIRGDRGAVAPLVAISIIGLVGMGALAWDVSRAFALRGELDAAVDAAALAGASQLDGGTTGTNAIARATTAARNALISNRQALSDSPGTVAFDAGDATIRFLSDLDPRTYTTSAADANFIEIDLNPKQVSLVTGALIRSGAFNVNAHAVAGYGSALCMVPPLLICNPFEPLTNTNPNYPFDPATHVGWIVNLTPSGSATAAPGQFGFLSVDSSTTTPELLDAVSRINPITQCYGETVDPLPGNRDAVDRWFNVRFDLYAVNGGGTATVRNNSSYAPALNTMIGRKLNSGTDSCTLPNDYVVLNDCASAAADANGYGFPRDCGQADNAIIGSGEWNVSKYFNTNHAGVVDPAPTDPRVLGWTPSVDLPDSEFTGTGWASYGPSATGGAITPTRFQVYNWEKAILRGAIAKGSAFSDGQDGSTGTKDFARPMCYIGPTATQTSPDRRLISAVVANCVYHGVRGTNPPDLPVIANVDLFLIAPIAPVGGDPHLFAEIVRSTPGGNVAQTTRHFWVRLYE